MQFMEIAIPASAGEVMKVIIEIISWLNLFFIVDNTKLRILGEHCCEAFQFPIHTIYSVTSILKHICTE